jgi:cysteine-rich repeat protein
VPASKMSSFWKHVTVSPASHPTTLSWDLYTDPAAWAELDPSCRVLQDTAFVTLDLVVPYVNTVTGTTGTLPATISNMPLPKPLLAPNLSFAPALRIAAGEASCGDGIKDEVEGCDDGNLVEGDGCSARCQLELAPPMPPPDAPANPGNPATGSGGCRAVSGAGSGGLALALMAWVVAGVRRRARRSRRRSR